MVLLRGLGDLVYVPLGVSYQTRKTCYSPLCNHLALLYSQGLYHHVAVHLEEGDQYG